MKILMVAGVLAVLVTPASAQQMRHPDSLRVRIAERFMTTYRQQAGLTDEQYRRFEGVARASWEARMAEDQRRRELFQRIEGQMRPGVAADAAVLEGALSGLMDLEAARAARARSDMNAYAQFLSPVQRAQLLIMMTRFERQVEDIMRQRMERMQPGQPGPPGQRRNEMPHR